ncbi:composite domain of metallo-dependent hydrolase [Mycena vulgaris]|nr:composite domain of metallo-dependent hydrolase [Mycena vulgaris]
MDQKSPMAPPVPLPRTRRTRPQLVLALLALLLASNFLVFNAFFQPQKAVNLPLHADRILAQCRALDVKPAPAPSFHLRTESDRFQPGTRAVLVKNTTIWTGRMDGLEVLKGDIFMNGGIIVATGVVEQSLLDLLEHDVVDAQGAWVTPGIVDMHSHLSVGASPALSGADDVNSLNGLVVPWLRTIDAMNTHDDAFALAVAGGITTSLILPGSTNAMGGQGFVIKLRPTEERSSSALLLEAPFGIGGSDVDYDVPPRWRHMKSKPIVTKPSTSMRSCACRTNSSSRSRASTTRTRASWSDYPQANRLRPLYSRASRGAGSLLAARIVSSLRRYKREAYRHSGFAPRILADNGLRVVMKSDHPGIVSRYLVHEAQMAHYRGLSANLALASVTSTPAEVLGLDHRVGFVKPGQDADLVVWDSHPLALGATPAQVFIDGIPQFTNPHISKKPASQQQAPKTPNFDKERMDTIKYEGLPPLDAPTRIAGAVLFRNVSSLWTAGAHAAAAPGNVLVAGGAIVWTGTDAALAPAMVSGALSVDLEGGSIAPALVSAGSLLGLQEISVEEWTADGAVLDPLTGELPTILGEHILMRAVDGLQFGTRNALLAYRDGVASAITAPAGYGVFQGLSLEKGAVLQDVAAVHISISPRFASSASTQIATLRRLLLGPPKNENEFSFTQAAEGSIPLVVNVNSADIIASLIELKREVEAQCGATMKMTLTGAAEAHLLAPELAAANVGVILTPPRSFPYSWEQRRILAGPPLTAQSSAALLAAHNVTVGLGPQGVQGDTGLSTWAVRNLRFDMAWVALESGGSVSKEAALAMASSNIETLLGVRSAGESAEFAVTRGGDLFSLDSKVVAMVSSKRGVVDLF